MHNSAKNVELKLCSNFSLQKRKYNYCLQLMKEDANMKDGKIRSVAGTVLILLQLILLFRNFRWEMFEDLYFENAFFACAFFLGFFALGITGTIFIFSGHNAGIKPKQIICDIFDTTAPSFKKWKITCVVLSSVALFEFIRGTILPLFIWGIPNHFALFFIPPFLSSFICPIFLIIYFTKYIGKKPSVLFSSSIIVFAISILLFSSRYTYLYRITVFDNFKEYINLFSMTLLLIIGTKLYRGTSKFDVLLLCKIATLSVITTSPSFLLLIGFS